MIKRRAVVQGPTEAVAPSPLYATRMQNTRRALRTKVATGLLSIATMVALALPSTASAADGWVYLAFGGHHCHAGGYIVELKGAIHSNHTQMWSGGDYGDNVVYAKVRLNASNRFNGWAHCYRPWYRGGTYRINLADLGFWPSYHGQRVNR